MRIKERNDSFTAVSPKFGRFAKKTIIQSCYYVFVFKLAAERTILMELLKVAQGYRCTGMSPTLDAKSEIRINGVRVHR